MNARATMRVISLVMFIAAVVFVLFALSHPELGHTVYIGEYAFGAEQWRVCYAVYAVVMIALFAASFFVKKKK